MASSSIAPPEANSKPALNTNYCTWRHLERKLTDWLRKECKIDTEYAKLSIDEIGECEFYDAITSKDRLELCKKKVRKVYWGSPIFLRFRMRNTL